MRLYMRGMSVVVLALAMAPAPAFCLHVARLHRGSVLAPSAGRSSSALQPARAVTLGLRGGEGKPGTAPDPKHVMMMGAVCGTILVLNEFDLLSVVLRVGAWSQGWGADRRLLARLARPGADAHALAPPQGSHFSWQ